jgi:ribosomal protein L11 methylase PrmA
MAVRPDPIFAAPAGAPIGQGWGVTPTDARPPGVWVVHVTTAGGADAELAADALWQAGAVAIEERAVASGVVLLAAAEPEADGIDSGTGPGTGPAGDPGPLMAAVEGRWPAEIVAVDLDAALDAWRPHARATAVGRFVVRAPWVPRPPAGGGDGDGGGDGRGDGDGGGDGAAVPPVDVVDVVIDPGRSFGSGGHASTRLALAALDGVLARGERVLDVGVGSGVLAIAALLAGARAARGVDIDPAALTASRANAARHGVADRLAVERDWPPPGEPFDLVLANMLAPTLVELAPDIRARLGAAGTLILSGLLDGQRPAVLDAYPDLTVVATHIDEHGGWVALTLRPSDLAG